MEVSFSKEVRLGSPPIDQEAHDRAVAAARASDLPKAVLKEIAEATRYAEGTGIRFLVRATKDLAPIKKLVGIKLAN